MIQRCQICSKSYVDCETSVTSLFAPLLNLYSVLFMHFAMPVCIRSLHTVMSSHCVNQNANRYFVLVSSSSSLVRAATVFLARL